MGDPNFLSDVQEKLTFGVRERWFRRMIRLKKHPRSHGFFDSYPRFYSTSSTAAAPDRLNQRHRALIETNAGIISGRRVLDIASHDGRWSLAAHKAGAEYVLGIEARQHLVDSARDNMREYGVPAGKVEFVRGDVMVELNKLASGRFDTVFCFGFLYHTIDHMPLFRKIARLKPTSVVIDTTISLRLGSVIEVHEEGTDHESMAAFGDLESVDGGKPARAVKGYPSKEALQMMLKAVGFSRVLYYDWQAAGIKRWDDLKNYYLGTRITATATTDS
jgi:2-polyprenyl-3-methyl-5-hydroxy-6-metoxy-1,4-benzoquinol methylase